MPIYSGSNHVPQILDMHHSYSEVIYKPFNATKVMQRMLHFSQSLGLDVHDLELGADRMGMLESIPGATDQPLYVHDICGLVIGSLANNASAYVLLDILGEHVLCFHVSTMGLINDFDSRTIQGICTPGEFFQMASQSKAHCVIVADRNCNLRLGFTIGKRRIVMSCCPVTDCYEYEVGDVPAQTRHVRREVLDY